MTASSEYKAELSFDLPSARRLVAPTIQSIMNTLRSVSDDSILRHLELALSEALQNAFEHGNFGITKEEKTNLCESESFEAALDEREAEALRQGKRVLVNVECTDREFTCIIEDQGAGFDWKKSHAADAVPNPGDLTRLHGRGLLLIRAVFDTVSYNDLGNKLTLIKSL